MGYFTSSGYKQGPNLLLWAVVAVVSAVIGGVLTLTVAPGYIATRAGLVGQGGPGGTGGAPTTAPIQWSGDWPVVAVADRVGPSVVGIISQTTYYDWFSGKHTTESGGSGVVFKQESGFSYIGTNQHVTGGSRNLYVVLPDGKREEAELVGEDWWTDLAVIRVRDTALPMAAFGDSDLLKPGELVVAIGNPVDMEFQRSVTVGVVSGTNRKVSYSDEREFHLIQTDAAINPGNSGGPLANTSGQVVGINNMKISTQTVEGMGFAIPSNLAQRIFNDLVIYGKVVRPYLGVGGLGAQQARQYYGLDVERGFVVSKVSEGSPAARAGLQQGDVIVRLDGQEINTLGDLRRVLDLKRPGDEMAVEFQRGGRSLTVRATLTEAPSSQ